MLVQVHVMCSKYSLVLVSIGNNLYKQCEVTVAISDA